MNVDADDHVDAGDGHQPLDLGPAKASAATSLDTEEVRCRRAVFEAAHQHAWISFLAGSARGPTARGAPTGGTSPSSGAQTPSSSPARSSLAKVRASRPSVLALA